MPRPGPMRMRAGRFMNDNDLNRLMDEVLDGIATPQQAARLQERLANDATARNRYLERVAVFHALGTETESVEPPADLAAGVMREIRTGPRPSPGTGLLFDWRDSFRRRPVLSWSFAIGAAAAVVAVASVILTSPVPFGSRGSLPVTGTMAPPDAGGPWLQADRAVLVAGDAHGTIALLKHEGGFLARVETHSPEPAELELAYDPAAISVTQLEGPQGAGTTGATPGLLKLELKGDQVATIHFASPVPAGSILRLTFRAGGAAAEGMLHFQ